MINACVTDKALVVDMVQLKACKCTTHVYFVTPVEYFLNQACGRRAPGFLKSL